MRLFAYGLMVGALAYPVGALIGRRLAHSLGGETEQPTKENQQWQTPPSRPH